MVAQKLTGIPEQERKDFIKISDIFLDIKPDYDTLSAIPGFKK